MLNSNNKPEMNLMIISMMTLMNQNHLLNKTVLDVTFCIFCLTFLELSEQKKRKKAKKLKPVSKSSRSKYFQSTLISLGPTKKLKKPT